MKTLLLITLLLFTSGCIANTSYEENEIGLIDSSSNDVTTTTGLEPIMQETIANIEVTPSTPVTKTVIEIIPTLTIINTATVSTTVTVTTSLGTYLNESTPEFEPTPDESFNWENAHLIYLRPGDGVYRFEIKTQKSESIIVRDANWYLFDANISPDGKQVIYWYVQDSMFQVWVVNTIDGSSKQLLNIVDNEFTNGDGNWHGQGQFFELGIRAEDENGIPLIVQWYLFDMSMGEIYASARDRPGVRICHTLAVSPQSNQVATWCSFDSQFEEQREYLIIEADGRISTTKTHPVEVMNITTNLGWAWAWSLDGTHVLVPGYSKAVIINISTGVALDLFADDDSQVMFPQVSPDGQFLGYSNYCSNGSICAHLIEVESGLTVWESAGLLSPPVWVIAWSPDGEFFVVATLDAVFILNTHTLAVEKTFSTDVISGDQIVWVDG